MKKVVLSINMVYTYRQLQALGAPQYKVSKVSNSNP